MPELHLPWLELSILFPPLGAVAVGLLRDQEAAHKLSLAICTLTLLFAAGEWIDFGTLQTFEAHDQWDVIELVFHKDIFVIDELSAPLLPPVALVYLMTVLSTLRTKVNRFSFGWTLASEAILLPWVSRLAASRWKC
jgi:NADH-quinone oxidoreductase subunit M